MQQVITSAEEKPSYQELMEEIVRLSHENAKLKNQRLMLQQELLKPGSTRKVVPGD